MFTQHASQNEAGMRSLAGHLLDTAVVFSSSVASAVYGRGRGLRARLGDVWAELVTSARTLAETASLAQAEAPGDEEEARGA